MSFIQTLFNRLKGGSKNQHRVPHIEGAERVLIDSSTLCCPVCYEVYGSVPSLLRCGHTFCYRCVRTMANNQARQRSVEPQDEQEKDMLLLCPLCREPTNAVYKNYIIDDLLRSVEAIGEECVHRASRDGKDVERATQDQLATIRLAKERADKKAQDLEQRCGQLQKELAEQKTKLKNANFFFAATVLLFLAHSCFTFLYKFFETAA